MKETNALIIFAREPKDGQVKTRLLKSLHPPTVTALYKALIQDVVAIAADVKGAVKFLYYADNEDNPPFLSHFKNKVTLRKQNGEDLGKRMYNASTECFKEGYQKAVIIGTDCVALNSHDIERAFSGLDDSDYCLGPSVDGGYYLLGMRQCHAQIFQDVPWGGATVLAKTLENIHQIHHNVVLLDEKEDIDTGASLGSHIARMDLLTQAKHTNEVIKELNIIDQLKERDHGNHA